MKGRLSIVFLTAIFPSLAGFAERLPVETFFRRSSFSYMSLSPDGKHMAAVYSTNDHRFLHITDLETGKRRLVQGGDVWSFSWVTDQRLLCHAGGRAIGGIFAINVDGTQQVLLANPSSSNSTLIGLTRR